MEIAVLGGGNGSFAAAVDLTEQGHNVRFWRRNAEAIKSLKENNNTLQLKDSEGTRDIRIPLVSSDIAEVINGASLIVCPTPATAQEDIAKLLAPHMKSGQVVYMPPGTFGSWVMAKTIRDAGNREDLNFAEAGTLPYLARRHGPFSVAITKRATRLPSGVFPLRNKEHILKVLKQAYPSVEDAGDALSGALMNAGGIIHPPLITMNAGPIEHFDRWDIHNEGTQPAIRRVTTDLDAERMAIREKLGYGAPHFPLADHYNEDGEEWMYGRKSHDQLVDSGDWNENLVLTEHRYMREDLAMGLSFLVSVGEWAGIDTPIAKAFLAIGSSICSEDFKSESRNLKTLGLDHYSVSELQKILNEGFTND